jgi:hypothetical protein
MSPCHSIHCRHYDLAHGQKCEVQVRRELAALEIECAKIVSSVHGVIPAAMANRLWELRDILGIE